MGMLKNAKHEHFAHLVAKGSNAKEAYIEAGFSPNGAQPSSARLLSKAMVAARIEEIKANISTAAIEKVSVDKAWVIAQLVENVQIAKSAIPVLDNEGNPTGEYKANLAAANRALELIGKEQGMFVDRKEVRTGPLDSVPHEEKASALEAVRKELSKRVNESGQPLH